MRMRKNGISYTCWVLYTIMIVALSAVFIYSIGTGLWGLGIPVIVVLVILFFALAAGATIYGRKAIVSFQAKWPRQANKIRDWEYICWVLLLVGAIVYRFYLSIKFTGDMSEEYLFYRIALERVPGATSGLVHRLTGVYTYLLFNLFRIFTDKMVVGIIFNALLQVIGMTFLYTGVKTLAGRLPALLSLAFVGFSSYSIYTMYNMTPVPLYFCLFAIGLFLVAKLLKKERTRQIKKINIVLSVFTGLYIGFLIYLDVVGVVLLVFAAMIFFIKDRKIETQPFIERKQVGEAENRKSAIQYAIIAGSAVFFVLVGIIVDAIRWKQGIGQAFVQMFEEYVKTAKPSINFIGIGVFLAIGLCFLGAFYILGFLQNRKQKSDPWIIVLLLLSVAEYSGMSWMNYRFFSGIIFVVLAGLGLLSLAPEREEYKQGTEEGMAFDLKAKTPEPVLTAGTSNKAETSNAQEELSKKEEDREKTEKTETKTNYIENPLPLPKKHEKKDLEFKKNVDSDESQFDFNVNENDDFDLQ